MIVDAGHGGNDPGKIGVDDSKEKEKCLIYPVRPEICRDFVCNNPNGAIKNKKLMHKKYAAVDMREIFFGGNGNEQ